MLTGTQVLKPGADPTCVYLTTSYNALMLLVLKTVLSV